VFKKDFLRFVSQTSGTPLGLSIESAAGPNRYTSDGRRIIDLISGIAVSALGHAHPKFMTAIHDQVYRHLHTMVYGDLIQTPQVQLAKLLARQLPDPLDVTYFTNSGAEVVEGALKLCCHSLLVRLDGRGAFIIRTQVENVESPEKNFFVGSNYPNPFRDQTSIPYALGSDARGGVTFQVFDLLGRSVFSTDLGSKRAGQHTVVFDRAGLPAGTYLTHFEGEGFTASRRIVCAK
jgi:hypothetical protein